MKVVILCGGKGNRLREETENKPKPMVEIGGRPILWHIMQHYAAYGFKEFVLALGYQEWKIKEYFLNYSSLNNDFTVSLKDGAISIHQGAQQEDWMVALVNTGEETLKGARIKRLASYLDDDRFMVTYGDGVSDVNLDRLLAYHRQSGLTGTFTGVRMPSRFGAVETDQSGHILSWQEKPQLNSFVNAGFFVFERQFLDYLSEDPSCDLEKEPLERLAAEGQLSMYHHEGFWQYMDTFRDYELLNEIWRSGDPPWMSGEKARNNA